LLACHPDRIVHQAAYQTLAEMYGRIPLAGEDSQIYYNPGLRELPQADNFLDIYPVLPGQEQSCLQQMEKVLASKAEVVVECSGLDSWHTSPTGAVWLPVLRERAYRVVIFDGGHHLPTLGMAPDLLIVPVLHGYAVHGYMRDGMRVDKLLEILSSNQIPAVMATVPRWRLIKTADSLENTSRVILAQLRSTAAKADPFVPVCRPRVSKYNRHLFIYVNNEYVKQPERLREYCRQLQLNDVQAAYIAFDYDVITPAQVRRYVQTLQDELGISLEIVNQPVKVSSLLFKAD